MKNNCVFYGIVMLFVLFLKVITCTGSCLCSENVTTGTDCRSGQTNVTEEKRCVKNKTCGVFSRIKELGVDAVQIGSLCLAMWSLAAVAHEWGHAGFALSFYELDNWPEIHIGTHSPLFDAEKKLFSLGNMHFYKNLWLGGLAISSGNFSSQSRMKDIGHLAAGGVSAATTLYGLLSIIMAYCSYRDGKELSEIALKSLYHGTSPFTHILNTKNLSYNQKRFLMNMTLAMIGGMIGHLCYGLTPWFPIDFGDGKRIWRDHLGVTGKALTAATILSWGGFIVSSIWAWKKYFDARKLLREQYQDE